MWKSMAIASTTSREEYQNSYYKGSFINYVRVPKERGLEKSLHTLTLGGQTHSYVIFPVDILSYF